MQETESEYQVYYEYYDGSGNRCFLESECYIITIDSEEEFNATRKWIDNWAYTLSSVFNENISGDFYRISETNPAFKLSK